MQLIYNTLLIILAALLSPVVAVAFIVKPKFRAGFWQKLGFYKTKSTKKSIWLHAVSVGEINATEALIKRIKKEFPDYNLVVSTVTATGQEIANKKLKDTADIITYFPYDFAFSVNAAINALDPALMIIAETEIWPGFIDQVHKRKIPLVLVNGRISPNSFKGYKKLSFFFKNVLKKFSLVLMQTNSDKERITKIGAPAEIVDIMGNLKFDISREFEKTASEHKTLIAGSTHQGEDEIVLKIFDRLKNKFRDLKLVIAPRHPERFDNVRELININKHKDDITLVDVMGKLMQMYSMSDIAFVGGSFSGTGGHNPLEPALYGVPVVSGPTVHNFKDIYGFMTESGAAKIVNNEDELYMQLQKYLVDDISYKDASKACTEIFDKNRGAIDFVIERIRKYL